MEVFGDTLQGHVSTHSGRMGAVATGSSEQSQILPIYIKASKLAGINIIGIDFHIGSQIMDINPYIESLNKILEIIDQLDSHGIKLRHIDIGGGLGISYQNESTVSKDTFVTEIMPELLRGEIKVTRLSLSLYGHFHYTRIKPKNHKKP